MRVTARAHGENARRPNVDGVEVRIADTGPGIPPELREQIFNPFVTTKKSGSGPGTVDCLEDYRWASRDRFASKIRA